MLSVLYNNATQFSYIWGVAFYSRMESICMAVLFH